MYKITNIHDLGTDYNVADRNGRLIKTIQVVQQEEILEAALGHWNEIESMAEYLKKSVAVLEGFEAIRPHTTLWFAGNDEKLGSTSLFEYAIKNGYERIILEYLDPVDKTGNYTITKAIE